MTRYYLDASAWVKRYLLEPGSAWINRLLERGATIACSFLGPVEVISAIARKERAGDLSAVRAGRARAQLLRDWARFVQISFDQDVLETALTLPGAYALRGADAVHLASAMTARSSLPSPEDSLVIIASDRELLDAAAAARFPTIDPAVA